MYVISYSGINYEHDNQDDRIYYNKPSRCECEYFFTQYDFNTSYETTVSILTSQYANIIISNDYIGLILSFLQKKH